MQFFDVRGQLASLTDPEGNTTTWEYDGAGRVAKETNALEKTRTYEYDGVGNLVERVDRNGRIITYEYDKANRNIYEKWYDDVTLERTIEFSYTAAGYLWEAMDPSGTYNYEYDALGRVMEEEQDIEGLTPVVKYASVYDGPNRLDYIQSEIGGTDDFKNSYAYDAWGRLSSLIQQSVTSGNAVAGKRADFTYNAANQFEKISRYEGTGTSELAINTLYDYDGAGRLKTLLHTMDGELPVSGWGTDPVAGYQFGYDYASNITSIDSYIDGSDYLTYDVQNQLTYDGSNSFSYDDNGNRTGGTTIGDNNQLLYTTGYNYTYDDEGNRIRKNDENSGESVEYTWDHRNRLVSVKHWSPDVEPREGWGSNSGASNSSAYLSAQTWPVSEGNDVALSVYSNSFVTVEYWTENVTAANGSDYTSTATVSSKGTVAVWPWYSPTIYFATAGNSLNESARSFKIHVRIQGDSPSEFVLEADILDDDGPSLLSQVDYTYDAFNQLIRRTLDADGDDVGAATDTFYSQLNGQIALQFDGDAASDLSHRYFWGPVVDQLLADEQVSSLGSAGSYLWPLADQVGTIRDLATHNSSTDETTVANHRLYDAFGNLVSETNSAIDEVFGFTGLLWDQDAKLQNSRARNYDPATGRFLSEDPIGLAPDVNPYRYVGNAPTMYTDPTGLVRRSTGQMPGMPPGFTWEDWYAYQEFFLPWNGPAKSDGFDYCLRGGKFVGWTMAIVGTGGAIAVEAMGVGGTVIIASGGTATTAATAAEIAAANTKLMLHFFGGGCIRNTPGTVAALYWYRDIAQRALERYAQQGYTGPGVQTQLDRLRQIAEQLERFGQ